MRRDEWSVKIMGKQARSGYVIGEGLKSRARV
jgi:hypothetical protein